MTGITYEFVKGFEKAMEAMDAIIEIADVSETSRKHIKNMADALRKEVNAMECEVESD
jgi:hypothetical protein